LNLTLVDDVILSRCDVSREHVEPNHATNQVSTDVLLPRFLGSAERDLDFCRLVCSQFEHVLGVESPSDIICLLLKLLLVQMTATSCPLFPLARDDLVSGVF